jgi:hypothetical protein
VAIHVGAGPHPASLRVAGVRAARAFLESLLAPEVPAAGPRSAIDPR